ncbi:hypothetical protein [Streptomyces sp. VRA16 Mangrove soil]|uniref:hypothetical protein n=1 Tax=Streptomyces sp. VRA16 Mangrove soil TaxID=2817434 RepID=UPI001A9DB05F|nr:hypothetical protein [Streptomyces sp. VRA16 Mangrove soil]MBO1331647.1 hypothetical protein [Streptomyces sp. VRA16 Mangrove soil]
MGAAVADDAFDFSPGAQIPLTGSAGQTAATFAIASAAYRDDPAKKIEEANNEWHKSEVKDPKWALLAPNLGEAFSQAVQHRMLDGGRKPLIQSFGTEPQVVVEHCLAASRIRRQRDGLLSVLTLVFGVLFLPGLLLWAAAFEVRRRNNNRVATAEQIAKEAVDKNKSTKEQSEAKKAEREARRTAALTTAVIAIAAVVIAIVLVKMPLTGGWAWYLRLSFVAPVVGGIWARQICLRTAADLRDRWSGLLSGGGVGAKIPEAVPGSPGETQAEQLRQNLAKLTAEQQSNAVFYAGPKGILGMGTRWGSWQLAEDLVPVEEGKDIHPFRSWTVIRAIQDQLRLLERGPLHTGGFPKPYVDHWIVTPIGENAKAVARPSGEDVDAFRVKQHEMERICNEQQFGGGDRHYLGVQFTLWDGQLVITMLITVTVLHETLRIEVTGHALGPVNSLFTSKPEPRTKDVAKPFTPWESTKKNLPLVDADEAVRLALRAPLTMFAKGRSYLNAKGGTLALPEPFGLRHAWADQPWRHRFMADDALRTATPVLRVVHAAALKVLEDHNVNTEKFGTRSGVLSGLVQDASPKKADVYDA